MLKDKLYWQVYNQKRKAYLTLKKQEWRKRAKRVQSTTSFLNFSGSTTTPEKVVDIQTVLDLARVVDQASTKVVDNKPKLVVDQEVVDHPILSQLIQSWQTNTNYSCPPTCLYSYCSNCWFFINEQLVDYKGELM